MSGLHANGRSRGPDETVHGTAVVIGEAGILVRGPSGAGKSSLALALVARARQEGCFSRLLSDDRVILQPRHGRIVMRAPERIAGLVEIHSAGLAHSSHIESALLRLLVDIDPQAPRYPDPDAGVIVMHEMTLPRLVIRLETGVEAIMQKLSGGFDDTAVTI
jgi:HPr kinase/phosphorylase